MPILAIESSCDETAAAILEGTGKTLAHVIHSQAAIHASTGGVVPEVASRNHLEALPGVVRAALAQSGLALPQISAVAATTGPGLAAALLVGASAAKGLAIGIGCPFLAINHMEGHMLSPFFGEPAIPPHIGLVVSGGHTLLVHVRGFGDYEWLGRTRDDAAGEAFDKVAKLLGLGYPGGVEIDRLAAQGDPTRFDFPRAMLDSGDYAFSFSGLKTAVRVFLQRGFSPEDLPHICASFQQAVVEVLVAKAFRAVREKSCGILAISGGVSSNSALRRLAEARAAEAGVALRLPPPELRTDNALMIAFVAAHRWATKPDANDLEADILPQFNEAFAQR